MDSILDIKNSLLNGNNMDTLAEGNNTAKFDATLLTCEICLETLYSPVNCTPCNHKFCSACMYRWLDGNHTCPKCRLIVKEVTKDGFVTQICEEFLKIHPEKIRTKESIEAQNKAELEFLEKLIKRAIHRRNRRPPLVFDDQDEKEAVEADHSRKASGLDLKRVFLNSSRGFRLEEWKLRSKRLREMLNLPAEEFQEDENDYEEMHFSSLIRRHAYGDLPFLHFDEETEDEDYLTISEIDSAEEDRIGRQLTPAAENDNLRVLPRWSRSPAASSTPRRPSRSLTRNNSRGRAQRNNVTTSTNRSRAMRSNNRRITTRNTPYNLRTRRTQP